MKLNVVQVWGDRRYWSREKLKELLDSSIKEVSESIFPPLFEIYPKVEPRHYFDEERYLDKLTELIKSKADKMKMPEWGAEAEVIIILLKHVEEEGKRPTSMYAEYADVYLKAFERQIGKKVDWIGEQVALPAFERVYDDRPSTRKTYATPEEWLDAIIKGEYRP